MPSGEFLDDLLFFAEKYDKNYNKKIDELMGMNCGEWFDYVVEYSPKISLTEKATEGVKILVKSKAYVEVYEDDYEEGEGDYANAWDFDVRGEYDSAEELVKAIAKNSFIFSDKVKDYSFIDSTIQTSAFVNNDNEEPSKAEIEAWKNGELKLYNAYLSVLVSCVMGEHEMTEDEAEEFGFEIY